MSSRSAVRNVVQALPRIRVAPDARDNSWQDVADLSAAFGLVLDPWQEDVLKAAMGERSDGRWASQRVGLSVPRQNGKSVLLLARSLAGALLFGERLIVVSAHEADTYRESTWTDLQNLIDSSSALAKRVKAVMNAINRESVTFTNGARVKFKARTGTGGRGFASDCLMLDEAQILPAQAWATIYSTMSARDNPQVWLSGTPPTPEDDPYAFESLRRLALSGRSSGLAYLEWAADAGDDPRLTSTRRKANPAWDVRINHDVVQGEFESYPRERFALERLGIWTVEQSAQTLITGKAWRALKVASPPSGTRSFGVKFSPDGARVSLAVAVRPVTGPVFVEVVASRSMGAGTGWLVEALAGLRRELVRVVVDGKAAAGPFVQALRDAGVAERRIWTPTADQAVTAYTGLVDAVRSAQLAHAGQRGLARAVGVAAARRIGAAGGYGFVSVDDAVDITPVEAVALARLGAVTGRTRPAGGRQGRKVVVLS
jgi:Terminase large subunit, T4likevirus-type, N-terminal